MASNSNDLLIISTSKSDFDIEAFAMGYISGVLGESLELSEGGQPVIPEQPETATAYSYNGVVLPKLPEWDKTVYPYAVIIYTRYSEPPSYSGYLYCFTSEVQYGGKSLGMHTFTAESEFSMIAYRFISTDDTATFSRHESHDLSNRTDVGTVGGTVQWTNYPIYNEDGTLYMNKSPDPSPVYE